jgi:hypothetical protein
MRRVLSEEYNLTSGRGGRQTDRTDALLGGFNGRDPSPSPHPLHAPSGEKTRKTYDFTRTHHVGTSCHDIQASQGATKSGVYLIHPANLAQGPWKVPAVERAHRPPGLLRPGDRGRRLDGLPGLASFPPPSIHTRLQLQQPLHPSLQVRDDVEPHENFMRGWEDYKVTGAGLGPQSFLCSQVGFGDFDREFWLGNILIWALTK